MKKLILFAMCFVICVACSSCAAQSIEDIRNDTVEYLEQNMQSLSVIAEEKISDKDNECMDYFDKCEVWYFEMDGKEFAVFDYNVVMLSETWSGFYYSPDDIPMNRELSNFNLQQDESGWHYQENEQSDYYYTERIANGWFFYYIGPR